ncbi:MAG: [NiFe]-hydrogenase assembly chaperone HybE [Alphaproteobacteria bacterium]|nr:[NiFe]-hydrogenase assembly chaperone HybE [Alphaproteobacteria bacterium]
MNLSASDPDARVKALLDMFREAEPRLRELPIYNAALAIEAIGFRQADSEMLIGVVLTPWFMNLVRLPIEPVAFDAAALGAAVMVALPAGQRKFTINGDAGVGLYEAHSLHSPVLGFCTQEHARAEAWRQLGSLLSPPPEEIPAAAASAPPAKTALDRRALIFGRPREPS